MATATAIRSEARRKLRSAKLQKKSKLERKRFRKRSSKLLHQRIRHLGSAMTYCVVAMHFLVIATFWFAQLDSPPKTPWLEKLWAWMQEEAVFYPLFLALTLGPLLSFAAFWIRGWHRLTLATSWVLTASLCVIYYGDETRAMVRVLWWQYMA